MAQLTEARKDTLWLQIMRYLSRERIECGLTKQQLRTAIDVFDAGLETAEASIISNAGPAAKTWLQGNQSAAREILAAVARKRAEVL
jgi:hypothetical protein